MKFKRIILLIALCVVVAISAIALEVKIRAWAVRTAMAPNAVTPLTPMYSADNFNIILKSEFFTYLSKRSRIAIRKGTSTQENQIIAILNSPLDTHLLVKAISDDAPSRIVIATRTTNGISNCDGTLSRRLNDNIFHLACDRIVDQFESITVEFVFESGEVNTFAISSEQVSWLDNEDHTSESNADFSLDELIENSRSYSPYNWISFKLLYFKLLEGEVPNDQREETVAALTRLDKDGIWFSKFAKESAARLRK